MPWQRHLTLTAHSSGPQLTSSQGLRARNNMRRYIYRKSLLLVSDVSQWNLVCCGMIHEFLLSDLQFWIHGCEEHDSEQPNQGSSHSQSLSIVELLITKVSIYRYHLI
jgi:hypothetical protein